MGVATITFACSGKDHSLGMGEAPAVPNVAGAPAVGTPPSNSSSPVINEAPDAMVGAGGARSSGISDKGASTSNNPSQSSGENVSKAGGMTAVGGTAATGGTTSSGGNGGTGGDKFVGVAPISGDVSPVLPPISTDCPTWANGVITFMGLGGIQIGAGQKQPGPTAPMLIYWHGTGSNAGEYVLMAAPVVSGIIDAGGILVSFNGSTGGDLYSGTSIFGVSDLNLVDQLVSCAVKDYNIDPRKIFTMGCSSGALFASAMAALRSNYIAAAAANSGGWVMPVAFENGYTPPLMTEHGAMGTDIVVVDFSQASATADAAFKARGGFVVDCNTGTGHCGGAGLAGDVWKFFLAHPYGIRPEPWSAGLPPDFSNECKIH
jgi:predicted esterase